MKHELRFSDLQVITNARKPQLEVCDVVYAYICSGVLFLKEVLETEILFRGIVLIPLLSSMYSVSVISLSLSDNIKPSVL